MASSTQISYECFDELIEQLRAAGHASTADKLNFMLHRVAWTTGSELLGELGAWCAENGQRSHDRNTRNSA
jgi:hypothetical protein